MAYKMFTVPFGNYQCRAIRLLVYGWMLLVLLLLHALHSVLLYFIPVSNKKVVLKLHFWKFFDGKSFTFSSFRHI